MKIYVASKVTYASLWKEIREKKSWGDDNIIISRWIDETDLGKEDTLTDEFLASAWTRNMFDVGSADVLVVYASGEDALRGALVEVGAALSWEIPVIAIGLDVGNSLSPRFGSWQFHPLVKRGKQLFDIPHILCQMGEKQKEKTFPE